MNGILGSPAVIYNIDKVLKNVAFINRYIGIWQFISLYVLIIMFIILLTYYKANYSNKK